VDNQTSTEQLQYS